MNSQKIRLQCEHEKDSVVSGRSSTDNRGTDLGLSSPCERAETSLPDSVELLNALKRGVTLIEAARKFIEDPNVESVFYDNCDADRIGFDFDADNFLDRAARAIAKVEDGGAR